MNMKKLAAILAMALAVLVAWLEDWSEESQDPVSKETPDAGK